MSVKATEPSKAASPAELTKKSAPAQPWQETGLTHYHNGYVRRAADLGCCGVTRLLIDKDSSLLGRVSKMALFAIASVGFAMYDVIRAVWTKISGSREVANVNPDKSAKKTNPDEKPSKTEDASKKEAVEPKKTKASSDESTGGKSKEKADDSVPTANFDPASLRAFGNNAQENMRKLENAVSGLQATMGGRASKGLLENSIAQVTDSANQQAKEVKRHLSAQQNGLAETQEKISAIKKGFHSLQGKIESFLRKVDKEAPWAIEEEAPELLDNFSDDKDAPRGPSEQRPLDSSLPPQHFFSKAPHNADPTPSVKILKSERAQVFENASRMLRTLGEQIGKTPEELQLALQPVANEKLTATQARLTGIIDSWTYYLVKLYRSCLNLTFGTQASQLVALMQMEHGNDFSTQAELLGSYVMKNLANIRQNLANQIQEKCAKLGIDPNAIFEKAGPLNDEDPTQVLYLCREVEDLNHGLRTRNAERRQPSLTQQTSLPPRPPQQIPTGLAASSSQQEASLSQPAATPAAAPTPPISQPASSSQQGAPPTLAAPEAPEAPPAPTFAAAPTQVALTDPQKEKLANLRKEVFDLGIKLKTSSDHLNDKVLMMGNPQSTTQEIARLETIVEQFASKLLICINETISEIYFKSPNEGNPFMQQFDHLPTNEKVVQLVEATKKLALEAIDLRETQIRNLSTELNVKTELGNVIASMIPLIDMKGYLSVLRGKITALQRQKRQKAQSL